MKLQIALDESHKGKNALHNTIDLRSKTGKLILQVVNTYKDAKIVYSTATPATYSIHFGILSRLEIWSPDKYWKNFDKFDKLMSKWYLTRLIMLKCIGYIYYEGLNKDFLPFLYQGTCSCRADVIKT